MNVSRAALSLLGIAALAGCDTIPTEAPILEQRWILPVDNTTISVNELLPSGVTTSGNSFSVAMGAFNTGATLGSLCAQCGPFQGLTAPMPAFQGSLTVSQSLPSGVSAATVQSGSVTVAIQNGFNFDPIAGGGSVTLTLTDGPGGRQLAQEVITGTMAAGSTRSAVLTLAPGAIGSSVVATAVVNSHGGQIATVDNSRSLTVTATPGPILVGSATVNVSNRTVSVDPVDLDVEDIDEAISDRIETGAIVMDVSNPFGVALSVQVDINYPGGKITKTLGIGGGATSTATLSYTGDEFRTFLGRSPVTLTGNGTVAAAAGSITVTPGQQAVINAKIDLTLQIGG